MTQHNDLLETLTAEGTRLDRAIEAAEATGATAVAYAGLTAAAALAEVTATIATATANDGAQAESAPSTTTC